MPVCKRELLNSWKSWELVVKLLIAEIGHDGSICTTEIGKYCKSGPAYQCTRLIFKISEVKQF